ncbi:ammonium transporter [Candidatus Viridilinea mediisalina]|uniref:Ammonium transporter n=1 Tax=Candidatus Viridilinea mediisalina TaxID=2024553 RepID=A0A2A6RHT0_9CHLR|nr:ammonium transporter [Candidatus Viridilinea mediisalina]PDW02637.1 ammonium transporter [Candidatus Viridilinea mediisalina]
MKYKVGLAIAGAFGLWLANSGTAFAQEEISTAELAVAMDTFFLLIAACLVFFMQAGFAMLTAGLTRSKNTANILFKNLMDFVMCSIAFWAVGWGLAYGTSAGGFIGTDQFFLGNVTAEGEVPILASWFFQVVFAGTAATIVAGAMAERTKFVAYLTYSFILSLFIYPVVVHWVWSGYGWLNGGDGTWGFTDFAGSTVVHSVGGWAALMGAIILGPRLGRFSSDGKPKTISGHSMALAMLGAFILWLGWFGFNPGSELAIGSQGSADAVALIAVNTNLAAAAGAVGALVTAWLRYGKPDLPQTINGVLAGLVAITAGCAYVTPVFAVLIGFIGGPLVVLAAEMLEKLKIDDPVGAVPVHLVVGIWGTLAVGLFAAYEGNTGTTGLFFGGGATLLIAQIVGILAIGLWTAGLAGAMFFAIKATIGLRVSKEEEEAGLDIGEHGAVAYPDLSPSRPYMPGASAD